VIAARTSAYVGAFGRATASKDAPALT
jgi:hypothetical protein